MSSTILNSQVAAFFDAVSSAQQRLLVIDYDGAIAPFYKKRKKAFPCGSITELLDNIIFTCNTRVVLVTGRKASEIPAVLGAALRPEIWGVHGLERLYADGRHELLPLTENASSALADAQSYLENEGMGKLCEAKPGAIAVHWRGLSSAKMENARTKAYRILARFACEANLRLAEFQGGMELRVRASNREHAVRVLLSELSSNTPVAYLGEDASDEEAFQELNGRGLTVLVRRTVRSTSAQVWLKPPEELIQFLMDWISACRGEA